jgi:soluble lytic murein transglycosylase-like protein
MTQPELVATAKRIAASAGLDPTLICAIIEQESAWDTYAIRPESESGFMTRYGAEYQRQVKASATAIDDRWIRFEDVFYCSYGLMQTMYPVIIESFRETAVLLKYPTMLCDPETGVGLGCRLFARKMKQAGSDLNKALLYWNGGGNKAYPSEVLARMDRYR